MLLSANVDTQLYEGNNTLAYYETVEKLIANNEAEDKNNTERITTEKMILSKLKTMIGSTPKIDPLPDALLTKENNISSNDYLLYLTALTQTVESIELLKKEFLTIEERIVFLKKSITNITVENKKDLQLYQLQYAFYKLKLRDETLTQKSYENNLEKGKALFTKKFKAVIFNTQDLEKNLKSSRKKLKTLQKEEISLKLKKERTLMSEETLPKTLEESLVKNDKNIVKTLTIKIDEMLGLLLSYLQQKKSEEVNALFKESKQDIETLDSKLQRYYDIKRDMIKDLMESELGTVTVALSDVSDSAESIYAYTYTKLTEPLFTFSERGISTIDILKVVLILVIGFMFASFYKRKIMNLATREKISYSSAKVMSSAGYYILVFITLIIALKSIGLDFSNLGMIAGALSIGIGFGLQTVVSNLAAGIILMFERTIRLGDYIEVSDTIRGTVNDMKMRSTTITTNDNIDVVIPNSSFIQNNVINWTLDSDTRRIHIPFSVAYGTENDKVEEVILEELKLTKISHVSNIIKYSPKIWMTAMGTSSVDYELIVWIRGASTTKPSGTKSDFLKFIYSTLNKHKIEIPFPQLDLHVKKSASDLSKEINPN